MAMAWNPEAMTPEALAAYPGELGARDLRACDAEAMADLVTDYAAPRGGSPNC